ncbi:alpha-L-rhamnosidase C-terminal domain-containing protein [Rapidithrix thailandica]|uniref:Alpha-L-rhamnosidase C-terminal domain-containing protein n=1 Tax=Rapidithrix thailandica TaxID=413964 RepID=A0AAW9S4Y5_9BACT
MKYLYLLKLPIIILFMLISCQADTVQVGEQKLTLSNTEKENNLEPWKAKWISTVDKLDSVNAWTMFQKSIRLEEVPPKPLFSKIAVDSKYWLWINKQLVVFEGGLKRGPKPNGTYYDEVDLSPYLKKGENQINVLVWFFGKEGFSHKNSGKSGLLFEVQKLPALSSNDSWKAWKQGGFGHTQEPHPNYRLAESNIYFDARKGSLDLTNSVALGANNALEIGRAGDSPWGELTARPIPQWKDFGVKNYINTKDFPFTSKGDTLTMHLPYNAHITPFLKVKAKAGQLISIQTDNYMGGSNPNVRAEYVTKDGEQEYESLGWMNGHEVHYHIPEGIEVLDLKYRETGYDTDFNGVFYCDIPFYNRLWEKSLRTLYVTMRDTYMDCPDRERAQWWGDLVLESGESFYALSPSSHLLTKKGILELVNWQRHDSTLYSPVPAGNWDRELPTQMLSSIGKYGFWNYYLHTGDRQTIKEAYPAVQRYLSLWKLNDQGTLVLRQGGWTWGDWGSNKDMELLYNTQYYMALEAYALMSQLLGEKETFDALQLKMELFKKNFNKVFWTGAAYRSPQYKGATDDRSQGLAVVAGLAGEETFQHILRILQKEKHASPYMEKYVLEALFQMGYPEQALNRMKERFAEMVHNTQYTTLWEGWGIGAEGFGGGTTNHAWSGGGLTLLSQYVAGVSPLEAGYRVFQIKPQLGFLTHIKATVPTVKGKIVLQIDKDSAFKMDLTVPVGTKAIVHIPNAFPKINIDGVKIQGVGQADSWVVEIQEGSHQILAKKSE